MLDEGQGTLKSTYECCIEYGQFDAKRSSEVLSGVLTSCLVHGF